MLELKSATKYTSCKRIYGVLQVALYVEYAAPINAILPLDAFRRLSFYDIMLLIAYN